MLLAVASGVKLVSGVWLMSPLSPTDLAHLSTLAERDAVSGENK